MRRYLICLASAAAVALAFVGCKPTEQGYRAAYDAAKAKREQVAAEQMRPATGLLSDEGPQLRVVDGDSLFVDKVRLRALDGSRLAGKWAVAIGVFKMDTNAKATVEAVREQGFPNAVAAKAQGGRYYALSDTVGSLDLARLRAKDFEQKFPGYPYVGLPASPVLISY